MGKIGAFGGVAFHVSSKKRLLLSGLERTEESRWVETDIQNMKPFSRHLGAGLVTLSFQITLKSSDGVNPKREMDKLRELNRKGKASYFVLGKKSISANRFTIRSITEEMSHIDNRGLVHKIVATIVIKEHPIYPKTVKKTVSASKKKSSNTSTSKTKKMGTMTITVKSVHIRSGPGTNYKVLGYAMKGDKLAVKSVKNGWYSLGNGKYITASSAYSSFKKA